MRYVLGRHLRIVSILIVGIFILVCCSTQTFALSPSSKTEDKHFRAEFLEAAVAIRSGNVKYASTITGLPVNHLSQLAKNIQDFSIEPRDLPHFPTKPPSSNPKQLDQRVDEFLRRDLRYPLLSPKDRVIFRQHLLGKIYSADIFLKKFYVYLGEAWRMSPADVKGIFIIGGWLWYGLPIEHPLLKSKEPEDLDLFVILDNKLFSHAELIPLDTGLGPNLVHIHYINENSFLTGERNTKPSIAYLKLLAYRGVQIRGPFYFDGQNPSPEQLVILANNALGDFINMLEQRQLLKALSHLREAEIILSYVGWTTARRTIDLSEIWSFLNHNSTIELRALGLRVVQKLFDAKEAVQIGRLARNINDALEASL